MTQIVADNQASFEEKKNKIRTVYWRIGILYASALAFFIVFALLREINGILYVFGLVMVLFSVQISLFKCPNCGKYFFYRVLFIQWFAELNSFFHRECVHCGFPRIL
jgi:predicted RNA-binding Zn-ribbon protein involved in translation (DUF1610 family)